MGFKRQIKKMVFDNMTMADVFSICDIMDNFYKRFSESSDIDDVLDEIGQSDMDNVAYLVAILEALVRHKDEKRYKEIKQSVLCSLVSDDFGGNWGKDHDEWWAGDEIKYSDSAIYDSDDSDYADDFANPDDYDDYDDCDEDDSDYTADFANPDDYGDYDAIDSADTVDRNEVVEWRLETDPNLVATYDDDDEDEDFLDDEVDDEDKEDSYEVDIDLMGDPVGEDFAKDENDDFGEDFVGDEEEIFDDNDIVDNEDTDESYEVDIDLMGDPIFEENPFSNQSENGVCLDDVTINCDLRDTDGTNLCGDIPNIMNEDTEDLTSLSSVIEDGD